MVVQIINNILKLIILVLFFQNININSLKLDEQFPTALLLSNGDLFIVTNIGLRLYDPTFTTIKKYYNFDTDGQIIDENQAEKTTIAEYPDGTVIAIAKDILYILNSERTFVKKQDLTQFSINGQYYSLIPFSYTSPNYYYIVACSNNNKISINYFYFTADNSENNNNPIDSLNYQPINSKNEQTDLLGCGLTCGIMIYNENDVLTCFYQINWPNELGVSSYSITDDHISEIIRTNNIYSSNNQASIIKSVISPDKKKALICYSRNYAESKCFQYNIDTHQFTSEVQYFNNCKGRSFGLYVYYFQQKNEYMFICSDNSAGFNVVTFDSNFQATVLNSGGGKTEPYYSYSKSYCYYSFSFNIVYLSKTDKYVLINDCQVIQGTRTGNYNLEQLSGKDSIFQVDGEMDTFNNNILDVNEVPIDSNNQIPTDKQTEKLTEKMTELPTDKNTEAPTDKPTEKLTEKVTELPTDKNTEAPTDKPTEKLTDKATEAPTDKPTEKLTDKATEAPTDKKTDTPTDKITEITTDSKSILLTDNINSISTDSQNNDFTSVSTLTKTKDEIFNNLNDLIKDKDPEKTYIMKGNNYTVIIKKVEKYIEESSVNIDFSECLKVLKEKYPSKEFRILQVILENKKDKLLTDQVEYKIYDQFGEEINLSLCSNINIRIEYEIKDTSSLDIEKITIFKENGIDIFNINDVFFNDICFSYSDSDSGNDMVLNDRIADIYQNYSICGEECEYESLDVEKMSAYCSCKVKQNINLEEGDGFFESYITGTFLDSNFGVAKCYNLVFTFKGKLKNAGFWIFGTFIIFHIPIYIFYFINGINPILKYIIKTMESKGYIIKRIIKNQQSLTFQRIETNLSTEPSQNLISKKDKKKINKLQKKKIQKKPMFKKKYCEKYKDNDKKTNENKNTNQKVEIILINTSSEQENSLEEKVKKIYMDNNNEKPIKNKKKTSPKNSEKTTKKGNIKSLFELNKKKLDKLELEKLNNWDCKTIETKTTLGDDRGFKKRKNKFKDKDNATNVTEDQKDKSISSKKNKRNNIRMKNSLVEGLESGELLIMNKNSGVRNRFKKKKNIMTKNINNSVINIPKNVDEEKNKNKLMKKDDTYFPLIIIDADNTTNYEPIHSNYLLTNYDFNEAIEYDKRSFCRIFYICLITTENNLNIIIFHSPLELRPLRICIFIFNYACDIALNALFFLSDNISARYHYTGKYILIYTLINNLTKNLVSTIICYILTFFFHYLIQSTNAIEQLFREQEILLKASKKYKVSEQTKKEIYQNISKIMKYLKVKIVIYIILESLFILFFFYYVTAFCQVYQSTQISWLLDCLSSYVISLVFISLVSFVSSILYKIAIKYKEELLYNIITYILSSI